MTVQRGWEFFRDDTRNTSGPQPGNNITDDTTLTSFRRDEPYHGSTDNWRVHLQREQTKYFGINGRFTYAGTRRNFLFDEMAVGTDRLGGALNRQVLVAGNGRRPVLAANLTTTVNPADALTIVNHTSFHSTRMDGDGTYNEYNNSRTFGSLIHFQYLGIQTLSTATEANYRVSSVLGFFGGYQYSTRDVRSIQQLDFGDIVPDRTEYEQNNTLHAGRFGVRVRPVKALTIIADGEVGRADRPIFPTSEKNYHVLGGKVRYKARSFAFGANVRTNYNFNSASVFSHSSKTRTYSADFSWSPQAWLRNRRQLQQAASRYIERHRLFLQQRVCPERLLALYQQYPCRDDQSALFVWDSRRFVRGLRTYAGCRQRRGCHQPLEFSDLSFDVRFADVTRIGSLA